MNWYLRKLLTVKAKDETISAKVATHYMDTNCGSLLPYHHSSTGYHVTLGNVEKDQITVYGISLLQLGFNSYRIRTYFAY